MTKNAIVAFVWLTCCSVASACNIPVFRYALERWQPDYVQMLVFANDPITDGNTFLRDLASTRAGDELVTNAKVSSVDPNQAGEHADLWQTLSRRENVDVPYVVVRTKLKERFVNNWDSDVERAKQANLLDSPARRELHQRLLRGDAIVWLLLHSSNTAKNKAAKELLQTELTRLTKTIKLPDGVGLPGSELYSDVPLTLRFSVIEIEAGDAHESYLRKLMSGFHKQAFDQGEPIMVPVFGRGRALEVLPADSVDAKLIKELTTFLCGACSCKVKGLNPGFDLLMSANWDVDLFGEDGERPHDNANSDETPLPTLISIPPGRKKRQ